MHARLVFRLARREMRGGAKGLTTFLACLALGVAAMCAVGSVGASLRAGVADQAAAITGGDLEVGVSHTPLDAPTLEAVQALGRVSVVAEMRAMAFAVGEGKRALTSLKAVDGAYPLIGRVVLDPDMPVAQALEERDGVYGAVAHPDLLKRLNARVGDRIEVGDAVFELRALLREEPDRAFRLLAFGPRLIISLQGLTRSGLALPGSMLRYEYRLTVRPGLDVQAAAQTLKSRLNDPGVRIRTADEASPTVMSGFQRLGGLMSLVGLAALLLGGLGVSQGVAGYLEARTRTIATLKAIGASASLVFQVFLVQVLFLAACGVGLGLAVGALGAWLAAPVLAGVLPVAPKAGLYFQPLVLSGAFGMLTALAFALPPLSSRTRVSPLSLFRGYAAPAAFRPGRAALAACAVSGAAILALVLATTPDPRLGWGFVGSVAACAVAFRALSWLLARTARALPEPRDPRLALALRGLHRPGSPTGSVVSSLGLGLTALAAVALSDANFQHAMLDELPSHAPSFFFLDVQPYQIEEFRRILDQTPGVTRVETAPSLRGRIVKVKGVPVENLEVSQDVAWAVRGDRSLTYAREMPRGAALVRGRWWPPDYAGPPQVSLDAEVAKGLGLDLGDTLTVSVLGREVELTVTSLRRINWLSLALNYALVLSPGVIDTLPMTYLATAYVAKGDAQAADAVYARVGERFGNVSIQRVDEALADVSLLAEQIATAMRASAAVSLLAGLLVLAQSLRASMARRVYETVILKVCGATRREIMAIVLCEHGLAGMAAGLAALVLGSGLSWFFVTRYMSTAWSFFVLPVAGTLGAAVALTLGLALAGLWRLLSHKAAPYLRNE